LFIQRTLEKNKRPQFLSDSRLLKFFLKLKKLPRQKHCRRNEFVDLNLNRQNAPVK
jgi:hypothetical protein